MAADFDPQAFFRRRDNKLLRQYFDAKGLLQDLDWGAVTSRKIAPLYDSWLALEEDEREPTVEDFRAIEVVTNADGIEPMLDEAEFHPDGAEIRDRLLAIEEPDECAFTLLLDYPEAWAGAVRFADADTKPQRYWRQRNSIPWERGEITEADETNLSKALSALLFAKQGRGLHCDVKCYRRGEREFFFATPQDSVTTVIQYDREGNQYSHKVRPAFDIIFVLNPGERTLRTWWRGSMRFVQDLEEAFGQAILGVDLPGEREKDTRVYDLEPLRSNQFEFTPAPELGIQSALVRGLGISFAGSVREKITIEIPEDAPQSVLYDRLARIERNLKGGKIFVNSAKITVFFLPEVGRKRTFDISWPRSCSLGNSGKDLFVQQMLSTHGIEPREDESEDG